MASFPPSTTPPPYQAFVKYVQLGNSEWICAFGAMHMRGKGKILSLVLMGMGADGYFGDLQKSLWSF